MESRNAAIKLKLTADRLAVASDKLFIFQQCFVRKSKLIALRGVIAAAKAGAKTQLKAKAVSRLMKRLARTWDYNSKYCIQSAFKNVSQAKYHYRMVNSLLNIVDESPTRIQLSEHQPNYKSQHGLTRPLQSVPAQAEPQRASGMLVHIRDQVVVHDRLIMRCRQQQMCPPVKYQPLRKGIRLYVRPNNHYIQHGLHHQRKMRETVVVPGVEHRLFEPRGNPGQGFRSPAQRLGIRQTKKDTGRASPRRLKSLTRLQ